MSVLKPVWQNKANGALLLNVIGSKMPKSCDPFLLLDMAKIKLPSGFPQHPHRGFDSVFYLIKGSAYHQDFKGHHGKSNAGDVNWMTAGRGIVHMELPASFQEELVGFQLWINLKSTNKMDPPHYQSFSNEQMQVIGKDKAQVKIICGKWQGHTGPIVPKSPVYYFDIKLLAGGEFQLPICAKWNSIVFSYQGDLVYEKDTHVKQFQTCILHNDQSSEGEILHKFVSQKGCSFLLMAGQPINQPIQRQGPYVMNTKEELEQAFKDYKSGTNGFQGAVGWQPKLKGLLAGKKYEQL